MKLIKTVLLTVAILLILVAIWSIIKGLLKVAVILGLVGIVFKLVYDQLN